MGLTGNVRPKPIDPKPVPPDILVLFIVQWHWIWYMIAEGPAAHKIPLVFYRTALGNEPVRDWLKDLERNDRLEIGGDLHRVQYRWPVSMPLCRSLSGGLWEIRTRLPSKTISRVLICFHDQALYALHGFIKKTQKTPTEDLRLARERMKEVQNG